MYRILSLLFCAAMCSCNVACQSGDFEFRLRPQDQGEVAVLRNIERVWPTYARNYQLAVEAAVKTKSEAVDIAATVGVRNEAVQFYETLDQQNAALRTWLVFQYTTYINSELDSDSAARERGRLRWHEAALRLQESAERIRLRAGSILEAARAAQSTSAPLEIARVREMIEEETTATSLMTAYVVHSGTHHLPSATGVGGPLVDLAHASMNRGREAGPPERALTDSKGKRAWLWTVEVTPRDIDLWLQVPGGTVARDELRLLFKGPAGRAELAVQVYAIPSGTALRSESPGEFAVPSEVGTVFLELPALGSESTLELILAERGFDEAKLAESAPKQ